MDGQPQGGVASAGVVLTRIGAELVTPTLPFWPLGRMAGFRTFPADLLEVALDGDDRRIG
jgi:hypothetical protein